MTGLTGRCALCGDEFPDDALLFGDAGRVCPTCEAKVRRAEAAGRYAVTAGAAPPFLALMATFCLVGLCIPVPSFQMFGLAISATFATLSILGGGLAFQVATGDPDHTPEQRAGLVASGVTSIIWGLGVLLTALVVGAGLYWRWSARGVW